MQDECRAKDLTNETILAAYEKLSPEDKAWIDEQADNLIAGIKSRSSRVAFGRLQALELLAKYGIWQRDRRCWLT